MNPDGSRGVATSVLATATLPALAPAGWALPGVGVVVLVLGGGLVLFAVTRPLPTTTEGEIDA